MLAIKFENNGKRLDDSKTTDSQVEPNGLKAEEAIKPESSMGSTLTALSASLILY